MTARRADAKDSEQSVRGLAELRNREVLITSLQEERLFRSPFDWREFREPIASICELQQQRARELFGDRSEEVARAIAGTASTYSWLEQFGISYVDDVNTEVRRALSLITDVEVPLALLHEEFVAVESWLAERFLSVVRGEADESGAIEEALAHHSHLPSQVAPHDMATWTRAVDRLLGWACKMYGGRRPVVDAIRTMLELHIADPSPSAALRQEASMLQGVMNEIRSRLPGPIDESLFYRCERIADRKDMDTSYDESSALQELVAAVNDSTDSVHFERIAILEQVEMQTARRHVESGDVDTALQVSGSALERLIGYQQSEEHAYYGLYDIIATVMRFRFEVFSRAGRDLEMFSELASALDWILEASDDPTVEGFLDESGLEDDILRLLRDISSDVRETSDFEALVDFIVDLYEGVVPRSAKMIHRMQMVEQLAALLGRLRSRPA